MMRAALLHDVVVRVVDIGAGGCLLEAESPLPVGAIGTVHLELDGRSRVEWFRVCRVDSRRAAEGAWLVGAEFLPLALAGHSSLRGLVMRTRPPAFTAIVPRSPGRSSGDRRNAARLVAFRSVAFDQGSVESGWNAAEND